MHGQRGADPLRGMTQLRSKSIVVSRKPAPTMQTKAQTMLMTSAKTKYFRSVRFVGVRKHAKSHAHTGHTTDSTMLAIRNVCCRRVG